MEQRVRGRRAMVRIQHVYLAAVPTRPAASRRLALLRASRTTVVPRPERCWPRPWMSRRSLWALVRRWEGCHLGKRVGDGSPAGHAEQEIEAGDVAMEPYHGRR
jgi:hypothetical protein